jgi:hypothetical protein
VCFAKPSPLHQTMVFYVRTVGPQWVDSRPSLERGRTARLRRKLSFDIETAVI